MITTKFLNLRTAIICRYIAQPPKYRHIFTISRFARFACARYRMFAQLFLFPGRRLKVAVSGDFGAFFYLMNQTHLGP